MEVGILCASCTAWVLHLSSLQFWQVGMKNSGEGRRRKGSFSNVRKCLVHLSFDCRMKVRMTASVALDFNWLKGSEKNRPRNKSPS